LDVKSFSARGVVVKSGTTKSLLSTEEELVNVKVNKNADVRIQYANDEMCNVEKTGQASVGYRHE